MKTIKMQVIFFTYCRLVFNSAYRMIYAFLPIFGRNLGVDLKSMSLALTARSVISSLGPFAASVSDMRSRKFGMLLGLALFTSGTALVVFIPTFPVFVVSIILSTIGKYVFDPGMQAYMGDKIPFNQRGRLMAITEFGWSLAFILGVPLAGFLIARFGWISPFLLFAILGFIGFIILYSSFPSDGDLRNSESSMLRNFKEVLQYTPAILILGVGLFISTSNEMINLIFGVWLNDSLETWVGPQGFEGLLSFLNFFKSSLGLDIALLILAAIVIGLSELSAEGLVSHFIDKIGKQRAIMIGIICNNLAAFLLPFVGNTTTGALFGLFIFFITFEFTLVSLITLITEIMPYARATLMAFNVTALALGRALGDLISPYIYTDDLIFSVITAIIFNIIALVLLHKFNKLEIIMES